MMTRAQIIAEIEDREREVSRLNYHGRTADANMAEGRLDDLREALDGMRDNQLADIENEY